MMNKNPVPAKALLAFSLALAAFGATALPARIAQTPAEALTLLGAASGGALSTALRPLEAFTGIHALPGAVLLADDVSAAPLVRAQDFLARYGVAAGVTAPLTQLVLQRVSTDAAGLTHVHLDQVQNGLPVFGGRLVVHLSDAGVVGMNGVFVPGLEALPLVPAKTTGFLRERALVAARKLHPGVANLAVERTRLMYYRTGLLKGVEGRSFLAYEAVVSGGTLAYPVRERVILNADRGTVLNRIDEVHRALNRVVYSPNQDTPPVLTEATPSPVRPADPALLPDDRTRASRVSPNLPQNNLFIFAGGTYKLYENLFGVGGYDFTDPAAPPEQRSVYLITEACPNAYWNGDATHYCPGFDADDIVSHEWSHAYTEYTHGLVYQYQSGALNEAYSDIFGEAYDLVNGIEAPLGTLTYSGGEESYFRDGGTRWVLGEDLSNAAAGLLLRDMWDPDDFGPSAFPGLTPSPGSTITSDNYYCANGDNGGVHTNSGVPNHAFAMLVDGRPNRYDASVFNDTPIAAIGMTRALHIYFQAMTNYQTPTSNFVAHADALERSCQDLLGKPLKDVTGAVSVEVIRPADCAAVTAAIAAVEFRESVREKCGYVNVLQPEASTPAACPAGEFVFPTFKETWEGGVIPSGWAQFRNLSGDTDPQPFEWVISSELPAPHTGKAAFADNNGFGTCAAGGDASASWGLDSPEITVPEDASFLAFTHFMQSEAGFDGGNLKVSVNGGAFAIVPAVAFTHNAHSGAFNDAPVAPGVPDPVGLGGDNTSPLAGELAWTGSDQGEATGSWGTTIVDIAKLAGAPKKGAKVRFRWEFGQDGCGGNLGWFVDDTQVFYCSKTAPASATPVPAPVTPVTTAVSGGRFGGGALGAFALLPLAAFALRRRKLH